MGGRTVNNALIFVSESFPGSAKPGGADMRDGPGDAKGSAGG